MNFGGGVLESFAGRVVLLMSGKSIVLQKNGPVGQTRYLWNTESEFYKMGMGWSAGSTVKKYEINF